MKVTGFNAYDQLVTGDVAMTLTAARSDPHHVPCVVITKERVPMSYQEKTGPLMASGYEKNGTQEAKSDMYVVEPARMWDGSQIAPTLTESNAGGAQRMPDKQNFNCVIQDAESPTFSATTGEYMVASEEKTSALLARDYKDPPIAAKAESVVRRLTPMECERLQGFPDGWTLIGERGEDGEYYYTDINGKRKRCADSARYKALGNSIAVGYANQQSGFWMWLMKRISAQYERSATLGSLFDGIGGFPLAWETYNGRGSAVWASEIEPFCIEVTRRRFPDVGEEVTE